MDGPGVSGRSVPSARVWWVGWLAGWASSSHFFHCETFPKVNPHRRAAGVHT